jgi:hypothetical protein
MRLPRALRALAMTIIQKNIREVLSVIPGLTRNPVTLPFYHMKTKNYELPT